MDAAQHTPGPWRTNIARRSDNGIVAAHIVAADGGNIAQVAIYDDVPGLTEAHARLIAAAPELLEALREVVAISDRKHDAWDKAHAAIAKAEGRA